MRVLVLSILGAALLGAQPQQLDEPFTASARWAHYFHRTYSPSRMALLSLDTAVDHALRDPGCWGFTPDAYGRRYARAFERRVIRNSVELAGGLLTGEDLRYRPSGSHVFHVRVWHAVRSSVTAQMPDGSKRPAYTRFVAGTVANITTVNWTRQPVQPAWLAGSLGWSTLGQVQTNLLDEFSPELRRAGSRIWKRVRGGE